MLTGARIGIVGASCRPPQLAACMHACSRLSCDSRLTNVESKKAVPCTVVTHRPPGVLTTRVAAAQSVPEQQSLGYQSWVCAAGETTQSKPVNSNRFMFASSQKERSFMQWHMAPYALIFFSQLPWTDNSCHGPACNTS